MASNLLLASLRGLWHSVHCGCRTQGPLLLAVRQGRSAAGAAHTTALRPPPGWLHWHIKPYLRSESLTSSLTCTLQYKLQNVNFMSLFLSLSDYLPILRSADLGLQIQLQNSSHQHLDQCLIEYMEQEYECGRSPYNAASTNALCIQSADEPNRSSKLLIFQWDLHKFFYAFRVYCQHFVFIRPFD